MPKEEKLLKKIKRYTERLKRCRQHGGSRSKGSDTSQSRSRSPVRRRHVETPPSPPDNGMRSPWEHHLLSPPQMPAMSPPTIIIGDDLTPSDEVPITQDKDELLEPYKELLGKNYEEPKKFEGTLHDEIAKCWQYILLSGLSKEDKAEILKTYKIPQNCTLLQAPILNAEVNAVLSENSKHRDKAIEYQQQQLGLATGIIGEVMSKLIGKENTDLNMFKSLSDATKLLNDLNQQHTKTRRVLISPLLNKSFNQMIEKTNRDQYLYGENLTDLIKTNKQMQQSSASIQVKKPSLKPATTSNAKNRSLENKSGPLRQNPQRQPVRAMTRGGPRGRGTQPSHQQRQPAPTQHHRSERTQRGVYYRRH